MTELTQPVLDGLAELVNIGVGKSAGSLNTLTGHHVTLNVPEIRILQITDLTSEIPHPEQPFMAINQDYRGAFEGTTVLMFPRESAEELFQLFTGEQIQTAENEELWRMTLTEVANIIVNAVMGSITNIIGKKITFDLPQYHEDSLDQILSNILFSDSESVVMVHTVFIVKDKGISGDILILLSTESIGVIAQYINDTMT